MLKDASLESLLAELDASRLAEQADLLAVAPWMKPVVVLRGMTTRAVLQHRIALLRGRSLSLPIGAGSANSDSSTSAAGAREEGAAFGRAFWDQLKPHLFPRASALAGLAVGWWVTQTYTDSHWRSALRSLGIGHGGTHVVSRGTYRAMSFWLPVLAAAVCAYLGDRLCRALTRKLAADR